MPAEPTLIYRDREIGCFLVDGLVVYRDVGTETPSDASWKQYIRSVSRLVSRIDRGLVVPRAAGLTARQREEIRTLIGSRPTAVVTGSIVNRCIITSLSWFKVPIHAFAPGSYREALEWLECEPLLPAVMRGFELYPPTSPVERGPGDDDDAATSL
ncbi:MAG TPA: hypothetical protein VMG12_18980 [Polyangiaceae bacterium]|nr:hypothetical protein [Polyangiaceae bacterium]